MVGVTGLEPATSCTPCKRASQLRHTPTNVPFYERCPFIILKEPISPNEFILRPLLFA